MIPLAALAVTALALACTSPNQAAKGGACDRASDCVGGLFCVDRTCTDDLSKLDGGNLPVLDSGRVDGAGDATDGGDAPPPMDTGLPPADTGKPPVDTGTPPPDTSTPPDTFVEDTATGD